jgi:hypothetical protein
MGKHATEAQKVGFLTHCEYVTCAKAARKDGLSPSTAKDILKKAGELCVEKAEQGLPSPSLAEQVRTSFQDLRGRGCKIVGILYVKQEAKGTWADIPQDRIRALVARMAAFNTLFIEHEGGNEFHG